MLFSGATIFLSALLLFQLQFILARPLLPWFAVACLRSKLRACCSSSSRCSPVMPMRTGARATWASPASAASISRLALLASLAWLAVQALLRGRRALPPRRAGNRLRRKPAAGARILVPLARLAPVRRSSRAFRPTNPLRAAGLVQPYTAAALALYRAIRALQPGVAARAGELAVCPQAVVAAPGAGARVGHRLCRICRRHRPSLRVPENPAHGTPAAGAWCLDVLALDAFNGETPSRSICSHAKPLPCICVPANRTTASSRAAHITNEFLDLQPIVYAARRGTSGSLPGACKRAPAINGTAPVDGAACSGCAPLGVADAAVPLAAEQALLWTDDHSQLFAAIRRPVVVSSGARLSKGACLLLDCPEPADLPEAMRVSP